MKITRQHLIRVLVPGLGATAMALTAYSATSRGMALSSTTIHRETNAASTDSSEPAAHISINGVPVTLDANGKANLHTDNGATIQISSQPPTTPAPAASPTTSITVTSDTPGQTQTYSSNSSSNYSANGSTSTFSSSISATSVFSNGDGLVRIDQSN